MAPWLSKIVQSLAETDISPTTMDGRQDSVRVCSLNKYLRYADT